ncbi:family 43 glycosylhydrolase [Streptomyces sp. ADMS]|uniref:family 43 glycosylhydrolase n=1 Tax=Streptomyces sp. ADMS TaxID=3071415 RepID=UPI0029700AE0|nr:family 43 glycosylhydrolase [Streptomyces sp. ADMS]MDW4910921.1 family 43 glycosylhydrolase [Streptomyces sp. ADMS]
MTSGAHRLTTAVSCNPLNIPYRYQDVRPMGAERTVHREAADPTVVRYRGRFYLFASMSAGFWHSADLRTWEYRATRKLPALDYAPHAREINGVLYVTASRLTDSPIFRSEDPLADDFTLVNPGFPFWDPHFFQDDDGAVYFYWGCSNKEPITGVRLDPVSMDKVGEPVVLVAGAPDRHGWEQIGESHVKAEPLTERARIIAQYLGDAPFVEGAWMTRHNDTYYLQYAAPGTEWNTYANGYYAGSSPLGPFEYSPNSPFSSKPGGFVTAAGHGSTFQDEHGNWWHTSTMRVSVHHEFERRIGLFPAGFDSDGVLFCNQNFGDYPTLVPDRRVDPWTETFAGWMLLSFCTTATTSSSAEGHEPELAVNEDIRTWWTAGTSQPGEWLQTDLGEERTVTAIQLNLADNHMASHAPERTDGEDMTGAWRAIYPDHHPTEVLIELSSDGQEWHTVSDNRGSGEDAPHAFVVLESARRARFVKVTAGRMPFDGPFSISGLRVFGTGDGAAPSAATPRARRVDDLTARIEWNPRETAQGYNVRYGIAPDKLYHSWLLYGQNDLDLRSLNAGHDYWVAVDSFNENGITTGPVTKID